MGWLAGHERESADDSQQDEQAQAAKTSVPTSVTPAGAEPFELPALPDFPTCQNCGYGFLIPIAFDAEARHEAQPNTREGDPNAHAHFVASGGALTLHCFICDQSQTQPYGADPDAVKASIAEQTAQANVEARMGGAR